MSTQSKSFEEADSLWMHINDTGIHSYVERAVSHWNGEVVYTFRYQTTLFPLCLRTENTFCTPRRGLCEICSFIGACHLCLSLGFHSSTSPGMLYSYVDHIYDVVSHRYMPVTRGSRLHINPLPLRLPRTLRRDGLAPFSRGR